MPRRLPNVSSLNVGEANDVWTMLDAKRIGFHVQVRSVAVCVRELASILQAGNEPR